MAGYRLIREDTAFSVSPSKGQKRPRKEDDGHLRWLRTLPCVITGERPVEAAHVRYADPVYGKRETGKAEKPDDRWALPLSPRLHRAQHDMAEKMFWLSYGLDPLRICLALYTATGDDELAEVILREARQTSATFLIRSNRP